ncbi:3-methyladenine DNA glycosylase AlkD [Litoreibacter halocynthiae]|uniref:3-methyladenine DNA glycosylase AlkD n=1 Tax=Litoreibacter halocynthiae TaxID=1242689 RepID=A0A4R7LLI0_9RHOB|nr:DNA alkylation repair protein [Litoreibacter halocynthiae]TDT74970.1 3-methyladenine DNA glycosylase AlkD [Litoreibacter halocynthiae]
MSPDAALAHLESLADASKADELAAYHGVERRYLGIPTPTLDALAKDWRGDDLAARLTLAAALWDSDIHEARICAAKLLTQARLRPEDGPAWDLLVSWLPDVDCAAIADQVANAGAKRVVWDTSRLDQMDAWTASEHVWTRRAVLDFTQPWTKQNRSKLADEAVRDRVLGWAALYAEDHDPLIQRAVAWWLRDLSRFDVPRVQAFLEEHGERMTRSARREAAQMIKRQS